MASVSPHPYCTFRSQLSQALCFTKCFLIDCMLCAIRLSFNHVMYFMVSAVVCILLKINCDAFWCFLKLLYIFDGSLK